MATYKEKPKGKCSLCGKILKISAKGKFASHKCIEIEPLRCLICKDKHWFFIKPDRYIECSCVSS